MPTTTPTDWIAAALQATVYDVAIRTPLEKAEHLSTKYGNDIRLKREDLQPIFSFKLRGAYNKISQLSASEKSAGVICASAGNHAQGVAFSANKLGLANRIIMPTTTPQIKVDAVKALGGQVILHGDSFDDANGFAQQQAASLGMTYIAPYDDPHVIAGQATIGLEIIQQWRQVDYVFVAVGGGGLVAGIAAVLARLAPHVTVVAVEPEGAACLQAAQSAGKPVRLTQVSRFADGVAVAQIGAIPFAIINNTKNTGTPMIDPQIITCSNDEICAAIKDIFNENRTMTETAGALAIAGMKKYLNLHQVRSKNCVAVVSGANINFDRLRYIAERTEIGEQKEAIFAVAIPEQIGAFLTFCRTLEGRNITEFNYRFNHLAKCSGMAQIFVGIAIGGGMQERQQICTKLAQAGYAACDLSDDETAKTHIRYLVGGHGHLPNEKLFRVMFPERPGALLHFLQKLGQNVNISLFHYRNHGAAEGRILVGLQSSAGEKDMVEILRQIGYDCEDLSNNLGYQLFLK